MKFALLMLMLSTVACHDVKENQPRNFADPAVSEALAEPMMSDVQLQAAASTDGSESSGQPSTMKIPKGVIVDTRGTIPLKQVAAARVREPGFSGCSPAIAYSAQWSVGFPAWIELPDGARIAEAAGSDTPNCTMRIARFGVKGSSARVLAEYSALARKAGFAIKSGNTWLAAARELDGAAFRVDTVAGASGTRVDLTSNRGANHPGR